MAKQNAKNASVAEFIEFHNNSIAMAAPPEGVTEGLIITNPPYGTRIGDEDNLKDVYRDLGYTLKHRFTGWSAWVLAGSKELLSEMKLKSTKKFFVYNGNIECRFLKYEMFEGSKRKPKDEPAV